VFQKTIWLLKELVKRTNKQPGKKVPSLRSLNSETRCL